MIILNSVTMISHDAGAAAVPGGQAGVVCAHVEAGGGDPQCDAPSDRSGDHQCQWNVGLLKY